MTFVVYVVQKVPEIIRYVQLRLSFICSYSFGTILSLTEFCKREGRAGPPSFCSQSNEALADSPFTLIRLVQRNTSYAKTCIFIRGV